MKKLVALAVAGAFVAPVYAAEITVSGEVEFSYTTVNSVGDTASTTSMSNDDGSIDITAVETLNGVVFTGVVRQDETSSDGATLTMAFPNGFKLGLGEQSGALDSVGAYSDISPALGGDTAVGLDHPILLTLPTVAGITAYISHSPKDAAPTGTVANMDSYAVKYAFPNGEVFYGVETLGGSAPTDTSAYGVKYTFSGVTVGYEKNSVSSPTADTINSDGLSLQYTMGDLVLGLEMNETKAETSGATATVNNSVMFAEYNLGSSVDIYLANESSDVSTVADNLAVGIEYRF